MADAAEQRVGPHGPVSAEPRLAEPHNESGKGLYRVIWEIDVEAEDDVDACYKARDAFAYDTSRGTINVCQYTDGEYSGWTDLHEVESPFVGPHPGIPESDPTSFKP